jgi:hypothetical protein
MPLASPPLEEEIGMSRITRSAILVIGLASLFVGASSSVAATWHVSGDTTYTATAGVTTLSVTGASLSCLSYSEKGTATVGTYTAAPFTAFRGEGAYSSCTLAGVPSAVDCGYTGTPNGITTNNNTTHHGDIDETCGITVGGVLLCYWSSKRKGVWHNATAPSTFSRWTLGTDTTTTISNGSGTCPLGNGDTADRSPMAIVLTTATGGPASPHLGPLITRTS